MKGGNKKDIPLIPFGFLGEGMGIEIHTRGSTTSYIYIWKHETNNNKKHPVRIFFISSFKELLMGIGQGGERERSFIQDS